MENGKATQRNLFPSPTGVTYYEYNEHIGYGNIDLEELPSPTGVTYYELRYNYTKNKELKKFPSPTGVTYYE